MVKIGVETELDAPPAVVWADVSRIGTHVQWMEDAESLWCTSRENAGVGATFECETRVGPLRTNDVMEITRWIEGDTIGVDHTGVVTGSGQFTLEPVDGGQRTLFRWEEELHLPWFLGGRLGDPIAGVVLKHIWTKNLANLASRFRTGELVADA